MPRKAALPKTMSESILNIAHGLDTNNLRTLAVDVRTMFDLYKILKRMPNTDVRSVQIAKDSVTDAVELLEAADVDVTSFTSI